MEQRTASPSGGRERACTRCGKVYARHQILRCAVCHTHFCRHCSVVASGRRFCSRGCGLYAAYYEERPSTSRGDG